MSRGRNVTESAESRVRADKWLWAARFFKTRALAHDAINSGKVHLDGNRLKPARVLKVGETLLIQRSQERFEVTVDLLSGRRGPATEAQTLYTETEASIARRLKEAEERKIANAGVAGEERRGRPTKRDRRLIHRFVGD